MNYWLIKAEPENDYSWDDLVRDGSTYWDGVRNYAARKHMRAMKVGDLAFYYHSQKERRIVGIARITKEAYQDPTTDDDRWVAVDVEPVQPMVEPVDLATVKATPELAQTALVRISRLSVQPLLKKEFTRILKLGKTKLL
jgi:predicted RNA-binding protein with PUA-like domain